MFTLAFERNGTWGAEAARYIEKHNSDLVAELVSCIRYLRFVDLPVYQRGLAYLLESQHMDGSWGNKERALKSYGALADQGEMLHTTMVALDALSVAFHPPWNRDLFSNCPGGSIGPSNN